MVKYFFSIINVLLVTAISFLGVQLFYQVVSGKIMEMSSIRQARINSNLSDVPNEMNSVTKQQKHEFSSYQAIINRDLLKANQNKADAKNEQIEIEKLKQTQLSLKLCGTVSGSPDKAYAVIEKIQNKKQGLYREGDSLENARIKKILRNTVVLNVNGKDEILAIKKEKEKSAGKSPMVSQPTSETPEPEVVEEPPPPPEEESKPGGDSVNIDREKVNGALKNINQLMSQVKVRPHFKDGKPSGLMLSHIQPNSIFNDMGLQSGDIVKGVNGNAIESVDDALKFYENLKSSSSVQLQVERQGEQMSVDYQIK